MRFGPVTGCGSEPGGLSRDNLSAVSVREFVERPSTRLRVEGRERFDVKDELPGRFFVSRHCLDCNCLLPDVTASDDSQAGRSGDPEFVSSDDSTER